MTRSSKAMGARFALTSVRLAVGLLVVVPAVCLAGTPQYPKTVQADADGNWSATIIVTGTTNPNFHNDPPVNSTLSSVETIHQPDGSFRIELEGHLINPTKNGSLTFHVDPDGDIVTATIIIEAVPASDEAVESASPTGT